MEIDGGRFTKETSSRVALRSGLTTVLYLGGGLALGFVLAIGFSNIPLNVHEDVLSFGGAAILLSVASLASFRWGSEMARLNGFEERIRAARIGALSFPIVVFVAAIALLAGEGLFGIGIPIHVLYGLLFVPAAFVIVAAVTLVYGSALRDWRFGGRLALRAAPAAAMAFFLVYLVMDAIGYRVGAPGAEERATMITVTMVGCLAAAATGGAALGIALRRFSQEGKTF